MIRASPSIPFACCSIEPKYHSSQHMICKTGWRQTVTHRWVPRAFQADISDQCSIWIPGWMDHDVNRWCQRRFKQVQQQIVGYVQSLTKVYDACKHKFRTPNFLSDTANNGNHGRHYANRTLWYVYNVRWRLLVRRKGSIDYFQVTECLGM